MDRLVIGAGVVGLAVAQALAREGLQTLVLEAAGSFGTGISSRNSEVMHTGIYYDRGSLKARLCGSAAISCTSSAPASTRMATWWR